MFSSLLLCAHCDIIFLQPKMVIYPGGHSELGCPNCLAPELDHDPLTDQTISTLFISIIGDAFSETRRMNLRNIAESQMGPYNPLSRLI
jgi:hypothetical protein